MPSRHMSDSIDICMDMDVLDDTRRVEHRGTLHQNEPRKLEDDQSTDSLMQEVVYPFNVIAGIEFKALLYYFIGAAGIWILILESDSHLLESSVHLDSLCRSAFRCTNASHQKCNRCLVGSLGYSFHVLWEQHR